MSITIIIAIIVLLLFILIISNTKGKILFKGMYEKCGISGAPPCDDNKVIEGHETKHVGNTEKNCGMLMSVKKKPEITEIHNSMDENISDIHTKWIKKNGEYRHSKNRLKDKDDMNKILMDNQLPKHGMVNVMGRG